jgi:hypothetical protein
MIRTNVKMLILSLALMSIRSLAQDKNPSFAGSSGCGDPAAKFDVSSVKGQLAPQPESTKALVYFIEDDSNYNSTPKPITRAGLDGIWVGATHGNSFLSFAVEPGPHHLCASWQSGGSHNLAGALLGVNTGQGGETVATSFTARPGGVYYFAAKNTFVVRDHGPSITKMDLTALDGDEGQLLANGRPVSTSRKK